MDSPSAERWRRIEALIDGALDLPDADRDAFLRAAPDDPTLVVEARAIIEAGEHPPTRIRGCGRRSRIAPGSASGPSG